MLICPICNNYVEDNATFCPHCGTQFAVNQQQTPDNTNYSQPQYNQTQYQPPMNTPPKKNKGLIIAIVVIAVFVLAGIGFAAEKIFQSEGYGDSSPTSANSQTEEDDSTTSSTQSTAKPDVKDFTKGFTAQKIGSVSYSVQTAYCKSGNSGVCYKDENGKYGIISFDGTKDTGAKYSYAQPIDKYFMVMTKTEVVTANDMNCVGLVDVDGKEILPMEYASIERLNDRYYRLCVVTGETTNKDDALVYAGSGLLQPSENDTLFTGIWYIYDIIEGKKVDGATGTKPYAPTAKGDFIQYITDDKNVVIVNHKGKTLPYSNSLTSGVEIFENGYYTIIDDDDNGVLYDSEGKKLFKFNCNDDFTPKDSIGDYFYASKYEGSIKYFIIDKSGKIISSKFDSIPNLVGDYLFVDNKLCKFDGKQVVEGTFDSAKFDNLFKNTYMLVKGSDITYIDADGNVIYHGANTETYSFIIKNDAKQFYSFKDKDFTIQGEYASFAASWIVKISKDNKDELVDTITGETILSGYEYYSFVENENNTLYVYAKNSDGTVDIYTVK